MTTEDVLTLKEAADLLKVSIYILGREARAGRIPARRVGGRWRFLRKKLAAWMEDEPEFIDPRRVKYQKRGEL